MAGYRLTGKGKAAIGKPVSRQPQRCLCGTVLSDASLERGTCVACELELRQAAKKVRRVPLVGRISA